MKYRSTCHRVPVVFGFKAAGDAFGGSIAEYLLPPAAGVYLAPPVIFRGTPDVALIRTRPEHFRGMIGLPGWENYITPEGHDPGLTAPVTCKSAPPSRFSRRDRLGKNRADHSFPWPIYRFLLLPLVTRAKPLTNRRGKP